MGKGRTIDQNKFFIAIEGRALVEAKKDVSIVYNQFNRWTVSRKH